MWGYIVHNFGFLLKMPNVKILQINYGCQDKDYKLRYLLKKRFLLMWSEDIVANTMDMLNHNEIGREPTSLLLEFLYFDYPLESSSWIKLKTWFPNLVKISTILTQDTTTLVAKLWPELSKLEILFGSDIGSEEKFTSALGILRDLREFKYETYCCRSNLSDLSVYEGFLSLPYLERVDICVSAKVNKSSFLNQLITEKIKFHGANIHGVVDCSR